MVIAVIVIALLAMALCVVVLLYRRELMRWVSSCVIARLPAMRA